MFKLKLIAKEENLDTVNEFVNRQLAQSSCSTDTRVKIDIAVEELFINIASYAYAPQEPGEVLIKMSFTDTPPAVTISFSDRGAPYNPLSHPDPDVTLPLEKRQIGGMGLYLVKSLMDDVQYRYYDEQNEITIKKYYDNFWRLKMNEKLKLLRDFMLEYNPSVPEEIDTSMQIIADLGFNSLTLIELVNDAEDRFNVVFEDEELAKIQTVGDILGMLEQKGASF